jgi:hypothetical protein
MKNFITTIFGSLNPSYLVRQYVYGGILVTLFFFASGRNIPSSMWAFILISLVLYPFSMFVYDSIVGMLMGDNVFFVNVFLSMIFSFIKIIIMFSLSILIAPLGILYLYLTNLKRQE